MYQKDEYIGFESMDGIWTDYKDHVWYFFIKDRVWQDEEVKAAVRNDVILSLVQKGCVDAFLLEIEDCLEPSDIPFCLKDVEDEFFETLAEEKEESYAIVLVDEKGIVKAVRQHAFTPENSALIKKSLLRRKEEGYTSEDFDKAYEKIQNRYEPYELETFTVFTEKDGRK